MEEFQKINRKKNSTGLVVLVVFLFIVIFGLVGYICYDKGVFDSLLGKDKPVEEPKTEETTADVNVLSEGFIKIDTHDNNEYKIYSVIAYGSNISSYVVSVSDTLYWVRPLDGDQALACIEKIPNAKFDSNNKYTCKIEKDRTDKADYDAEIYKFNGSASDLVKVTSSIAYFSTDGSKYPIFIYKSGNVESAQKDTNDVLKDYKIKDFISEKCIETDANSNGPAMCKKVEYKVLLQDGTEKTITKAVNE